MSMIYQTATPYAVSRKPARATRVRTDRTVRESANLLKQAVVATIGAIGAIAWGMALFALI